ncbi:MAG: hypothetical protein AAGF74_11800 [Pseudomonadota bacterium]
MFHSARIDYDPQPEPLTLPTSARVHATDQPGPLNDTASNDHPLLSVPYELIVGDRHFEGARISLLGGLALGTPGAELTNRPNVALFRFVFRGFSVSFTAEVILKPLGRPESGEFAFSFVEPADDHLPQLRYLLNAYVAGDVVSLGDVLTNGAGREPSRGGDAAAQPHRFSAGSALRGLLVVGSSLALLALAANTAQTRLLTSVELRPALVAQDGIELRAPASGQIDFINRDARDGEVAFTLLSTTGAVLSIRMPCACTVNTLASEGATVLAGEPVLALHPAEAETVVRAVMSFEGLQAALSGDDIELVFPDGRAVPATLDTASGKPIDLAGEQGATEVVLRPAEPLDAADQGQLVNVRLHHRVFPKRTPGDGAASPLSALFANQMSHPAPPAAETGS